MILVKVSADRMVFGVEVFHKISTWTFALIHDIVKVKCCLHEHYFVINRIVNMSATKSCQFGFDHV